MDNESVNHLPLWAMGGFVRPVAKNPIIEPDKNITFYCPMTKKQVAWKENDTFNPAAVVKDGKIYVLYRAEDNTAPGLGSRTSRIGLAESTDGIDMVFQDTPVLYPDDDNFKDQ